MEYDVVAIPAAAVPAAREPVFEHLLDTYASETNKVFSTWLRFTGADLAFRPHPRSSTVLEIFRHQLLSERRFFGEFLEVPEPAAEEVLPSVQTVKAFADRLRDLAAPRLEFLAAQPQAWWLEPRPFFDIERQRIWIFWRRVLHTAHHRTQLTVYLRLLDKPVPSTYGPTANITWQGADPTRTVDAAKRK
jgi:uncharacterized damage-inducible protein DinB